MDKALAAKAYIRQQTRKAADYFKPTENVRVRDFVREVPGAVGQMFSGTRDTVVKGGKILGEGLAYSTSPNVRKMYQAGNTNILPTVSNTTPRQMLGNTAKSAMELLPVSKIKGLATAAMSAKLAPRMIAGGAMGYGYDVADRFSRPEPISQSTFNPGIATLAGALMGGLSKPTAQMIGQTGREIGDDIRNINPANRLSHKVVDKYDMEPVPGVFAPGGKQQMRPIMESFRKEVETTQMPFEPQSSIAKLLLGKQAPVGMSIKAVDDPLLQEARKYGSAEEFVKAQGKTYYHATDKNFDDFNPSMNPDDVGTWFAGNKANVLDPEVAKTLPIVKEQVVKPGTKLITEEQLSRFEKTPFVLNSRKPIHELLMEKGYRGIRYAGDDIQLFEPNVDTIAKSKLTDLWKKANQSSPDQYLLNEARKYKSAEHFIYGDEIGLAKKGNQYENVRPLVKQVVDPSSFGSPLGKDGDIISTQSIDEAQVQKYMKIIEEKIAGKKLNELPIVILEKRAGGKTAILDGHNRAEAYRRYGYAGPEGVPVIWRDQLTDLWKKANQSSPDQYLLNEARKYKSAEEFVNSFNLMKSGEVTSIGQLPISKVNKTQIRAITERGLPHTDTGLKVKDFTPGRKVTQPLEVYSKGGSYVVENGNHRLAQALANGDTHIPVVFKRGEGKTYSTHTKSQLTDLYHQATKE